MTGILTAQTSHVTLLPLLPLHSDPTKEVNHPLICAQCISFT